MTVTSKATSPVSDRQARSAKKPVKKAMSTKERSAQSERARKRWAGTTAEDRSENARGMALHRWATTEHGYAEAEQYFKAADMDEATETYAQIRKIFEMAGKTLDTRFQADQQEKCSNPDCPIPGGKRFDRNSPWYLRVPQKDPATGRLYNRFACSPGCAVALNLPGTKPREAPITDARNPNYSGMQ